MESVETNNSSGTSSNILSSQIAVPELSNVTNPVDEAKKILAELKAENNRRIEIIKKEEELRARDILGGRSNAGALPPKIETEDERALREAKELLKGTGLDPFK